MATLVKLESSKTYKTHEAAVKAAMVFEAPVRFMIVLNEEGRYYPVFIGADAVKAGTHFRFVTVC